MRVVILAGGLGTRIQEETTSKPKPMVEIGGRPILWHIMNIYARSGYNEFIIALGYKGEVIKDYFMNYYYSHHGLTVHLKNGRVDVHAPPTAKEIEDWRIHLIDTGGATETGGRIKLVSSWVEKGTFLMTYGDGVANLNVSEVVAFHRRHGKLATVTAVRPPARFGGLVFEGDLVTQFSEKPQIGEGWINGGFFVFEPGVLDYIQGAHSIFEREPLERLAEDGQLVAYRHEGFWQCMDTLRDLRLLERLWETGEAPWKVWD